MGSEDMENKDDGNNGMTPSSLERGKACGMKTWYKSNACSFLSLIVPTSWLFIVEILLYARHDDYRWMFVYFGIFCMICVTWFFLSYLFFPRIVITVTASGSSEVESFRLWARGRCMLNEKNLFIPFQFSFQVWRRGVYDLCVEEGSKASILKANTYEQKVCHVIYESKENQMSVGKPEGVDHEGTGIFL